MSFQAKIHDLSTGRFILHCNVEATDLHDAENAAIAQAALTLFGSPHDMEVRRLHQCASRVASYPLHLATAPPSR